MNWHIFNVIWDMMLLLMIVSGFSSFPMHLIVDSSSSFLSSTCPPVYHTSLITIIARFFRLVVVFYLSLASIGGNGIFGFCFPPNWRQWHRRCGSLVLQYLSLPLYSSMRLHYRTSESPWAPYRPYLDV